MKIIFSEKAQKQFLKLEKSIQKNIHKLILKLECLENPYCFGKSLVGNYLGLYRYRVGDYRILGKITDNELLVVEIGHRKEVYKKL